MNFDDETRPIDPFIGSTLDERYRINSMLGQGGMGSVYQATHLSLGKSVAVKIVHPQLALDDNALRRFRQEVQAMSALAHPNLITIQDVGMTPFSTPYLVMEYLSCMPLSEILREESPLAVERAGNILVQIAEGLAHAHERGIVHRDLKPANVLIVNSGSKDFVKIVDLGIAKLLTSSANTLTQLTQTGEVFGSPLYMSPEQCLGKPQDHRTDIYAFGCLMYQILTGRPPFVRSSALAVINSHMNEAPSSFADADEELKMTPELKEMERLSLWCLEKDAAKRPQSMGEVISSLSGKTPATRVVRSSQKDIPGETSRRATAASQVKQVNQSAAKLETVQQSAAVPFYADRKVLLALFVLIGFISLVAGTVAIVQTYYRSPPLPPFSPAAGTIYNTGGPPINGTTAEQIEWALRNQHWDESKVEFPDALKEPGPELRIFSVYGGDPDPNQTFDKVWRGHVEVKVNREKPVVLVLNSYGPVKWQIRTGSDKVKIDKIIAVSYFPSKVIGAPPGTKVEYVYQVNDSGGIRTESKNPFEPFYFLYSAKGDDVTQGSSFASVRENLERYTGLKVASFRGIQVTKEFQLN